VVLLMGEVGSFVTIVDGTSTNYNEGAVIRKRVFLMGGEE